MQKFNIQRLSSLSKLSKSFHIWPQGFIIFTLVILTHTNRAGDQLHDPGGVRVRGGGELPGPQGHHVPHQGHAGQIRSVRSHRCRVDPKYNWCGCSGFCWMHGTAYVRHHLQGQATGCYVDQSKLVTTEQWMNQEYCKVCHHCRRPPRTP